MEASGGEGQGAAVTRAGAGLVAVAIAALLTLVPGDMAIAAVELETDPPIEPAFKGRISDYVVACDNDPVTVNARTTGRTRISIDDSRSRSGAVRRKINRLRPGQRFAIEVRRRSGTRRHHVRCLPEDYPAYEYTRRGRAARDQYVFTPTLGETPGDTTYVSIFDDRGAPLWWWGTKAAAPIDAKVLGDGSIAFARLRPTRAPAGEGDPGYQVRGPDGSPRARLRTVGSPTDPHDLIELANGNFLLLTYRVREGVDLSPYGGPADTAIFDSEVQEQTPDGELVWSWNSADEISLDETEDWWETVLDRPEEVEGVGDVYDPTHINSVEPSGRGVIISLRHTDGVYRVTRGGKVDWKLGGTPTPESLELRNDPVGGDDPLGGQHDARLLDDGTITIHDNASLNGRPPRSVRYEIDEDAGTATLVESNSDPERAPTSACCGSSRLIDGSWVASWGGGNYFAAEYGPDGDLTWRVDTPLVFSYRAVPVEPGYVSDAELRAGMDAMHPRRPRGCGPSRTPGPAGTPGADRLTGAGADEYIIGLAGGDRLRGRGGQDCLLGERGRDRLGGGSSADLLLGGPGRDHLNGRDGRDVLRGGRGRDRLEGGPGSDSLHCGPGRDVAIAAPGDSVSPNCERVIRPAS